MRCASRRVIGALASGAGVLVVVSALLFASVEVLPGDVATQILGTNATPERVERLRAELNLDEPAPVRYLSWLGGVVQGDLGQAATTQRSVWATIAAPVRNTAILAGAAFSAVVAVAVGGGVLAGRRPGGRVDRTVSALAVGAFAVPEFVVAGVLVAVVAFGLGWLPAVSLVPLGGSPLDEPSILVLPVASLTIVGGAFGLRLVRAAVADVAVQPHVEAARLAGLGEARVLVHHLLPVAAGPVARVLSFLVPYLVGGTVVVERVFAYPGLGSLLVDQIAARDATVVEAIGLLLATSVVVAFLAADLVAGRSVGRSVRQPANEHGGVGL